MDVVEQTLLRRTSSPNGRLELLLFTRDAGATTSTGYFLQVVERGDSPDPSSAFLVLDHCDCEAIEASWVGDSTVRVILPDASVVRKEGEAGVGSNQVKIEYVAMTAAGEP